MATSLNPSATADIVARASALFEDLSFTSAREWKAAKPGRKVIGYMPIYVPREIIHAAGMLPLGIVGGGDQLEVIHGDAYYQSYICRIPRSTIELGVSGRIDFVDGMLFPSICDVIRNLSGMWKLMFPHVYSHYFDVPQNYRDDIGGNFYIKELAELRHDLGELRGQPITDDELRHSIAVYNENRRLVRDLYDFRAERPWQAPAAEVYLMVRAGLVLPVEEHTIMLREYLAAARADERPMRDNCRVVLTGMFCEQPPLNLIKSLELSGCYVVDDDLLLVTRWLIGDVAIEGDPLQNLSLAFLHHSEVDSVQIRTRSEGKGPASRPRGQTDRGGRRHLCRTELLRSGFARAADAAACAQGSRHPLHRVQVCRELRPDAANSRAGRHVRRFNQTMERIMTTQTKIVTTRAPVREAVKDASMVKQKEMMAAHYDRLTSAPETGDKVATTFVPGNLNELIMCFGLLNNLPEVNAIQNGLRRVSGSYVLEAEKLGHSEDVCTYVKSDIGMMSKGNIAPNGKKFPNPDVLLLSYTGCFTFMKWFELLREQYKCETIMLHTPYMGDGKITKNMVEYMMKQLKEEVIPKLERVSGVKFDIDRLRESLKKSVKAEDDLVRVLQSAKNKPSPIDAYFGAIYYIGPIFGAFRGTDDAIDYYKFLREEVEDRLAKGLGPVTPDGDMGKEKYRLVVEGPPNYTSFRQFWKMFYDEGAVVVASSYSKVGGVYDFGFRHDPSKPLETLAEYCLGVYTNRSLPMRIDMLVNYINEYEADGLLINSIKSCNSFSAGQLLMMREVEKRTGKPAAFVESDLVDPRYFSAANIKNRLESYFQMIDQRRAGVDAAA